MGSLIGKSVLMTMGLLTRRIGVGVLPPNLSRESQLAKVAKLIRNSPPVPPGDES